MSFATERLCALWRTPEMWAATREAFAAQVALLLELLEVDSHQARVFMRKVFKTPGTCGVDRDKLIAPVDDAWARALVDDAAKLAKVKLNPLEHSALCKLLDSPARKRGWPFTCICGVQKP